MPRKYRKTANNKACHCEGSNAAPIKECHSEGACDRDNLFIIEEIRYRFSRYLVPQNDILLYRSGCPLGIGQQFDHF